jgi:hypothetical protein
MPFDIPVWVYIIFNVSTGFVCYAIGRRKGYAGIDLFTLFAAGAIFPLAGIIITAFAPKKT